MQHIFIISDGTGGTAEQALRAALAQFRDTEVKINKHGDVITKQRASEIILEASKVDGFVVHTIVSQELRNEIGNLGRLFNVRTIDVMGPLLAQLADQFLYLPVEKPGLFRHLNKEYFKRIEAMEFAFRHDDGQRADELDKSDMVLVGVSRTFKTPLCIYFAFKGWLVGNVPIVLNLPVPEVLSKLPPEKVICLTTDAYSLSKLRKVRHDYLGGATGGYADLEYVQKEIAYARNLYIRHPNWKIIEVTNKPIEEISTEILEVIRKVSSF